MHVVHPVADEWTDVTVPFGAPADGRALAHAIAAAVGGVVTDRI